jgi:hypothetical protein
MNLPRPPVQTSALADAARQIGVAPARLERPELERQIAELRRGQDELRRGQDELYKLVRGLQRGRDGLEEGRAKAIAARRKLGEASRTTVQDLMIAYASTGRPQRDMAAWISKKAGLSRSQVGKILLTLSNMSRSPAPNAGNEGDTRPCTETICPPSPKTSTTR